MTRHGAQPNPALPPEWTDTIVHARIEIGATVLMGADIPHAEPLRSAYLALSRSRSGARRRRSARTRCCRTAARCA